MFEALMKSPGQHVRLQKEDLSYVLQRSNGKSSNYISARVQKSPEEAHQQKVASPRNLKETSKNSKVTTKINSVEKEIKR